MKKYFFLVVLFNCALLISMASGYWNHPYLSAFIIITLLFQFFSEDFWKLTIISIIFYLITYIPLFPRTTNHDNLEAFIGFSILLLYLLRNKINSNKKITPNILSNCFRYTLISIYFFAGFNKLNESFFDISLTCSSYINNNLHQLILGDNFSPSIGLVRISQILTIVVEMILPFGLLFKNLRTLSGAILIFFHFYLSLCGFSNFSALAGFLIAGSLIDFREIDLRFLYKKGIKPYIFFSILSVITSFIITRFHLVESNMIRFYNGLIFNIGWCILFFQIIRSISYYKHKERFSLIPFLPVLLITLWSTQAYIGLSNAGNLTMFSNLITEKSKSNHYLIDTDKTKFFDFEEDLVYIKELPNKFKWENSENLEGFYLPLIEFKVQASRWVRKSHKPIECTIIYNKNVIHINNLKNSTFSKIKWWYPLLHFRKIPPNGKQPCVW